MLTDSVLMCSKEGGLSTADTVADGGPDDQEEDGEFKP